MKFLIQWIWEETQDSACLTSSYVMQSVGLRTEVESSASLYNGAESNLGDRVLYEVEKTSLLFSQAKGAPAG